LDSILEEFCGMADLWVNACLYREIFDGEYPMTSLSLLLNDRPSKYLRKMTQKI